MEEQRTRRLSMVSQASKAIDGLSKSDVTELKSYKAPPAAVKDVMKATMILLGKTELDWKDTQRYLGDTSLIKDIAGLDCETVTPDAHTKAMEILSKYSTEKVKSVSKAAAAMYDWADAVTKV